MLFIWKLYIFNNGLFYNYKLKLIRLLRTLELIPIILLANKLRLARAGDSSFCDLSSSLK